MSASPRAVLMVRVVPRAARSALARDARGGLRVHLTAPPVEGQANRALIALLAAALRLPKSAFTVIHGARGRDKRIRVEGCSEAGLAQRLARALESAVDKA